MFSANFFRNVRAIQNKASQAFSTASDYVFDAIDSDNVCEFATVVGLTGSFAMIGFLGGIFKGVLTTNEERAQVIAAFSLIQQQFNCTDAIIPKEDLYDVVFQGCENLNVQDQANQAGYAAVEEIQGNPMSVAAKAIGYGVIGGFSGATFGFLAGVNLVKAKNKAKAAFNSQEAYAEAQEAISISARNHKSN